MLQNKMLKNTIVYFLIYWLTIGQLSAADLALPSNGVVTSGSAQISSTETKMTINQSTDQAIINWNTFNIGKDAQVQFIQPSVDSSTLNRVLSVGASSIFGQLTSNGKVFLVNPNGILFGPSSSVDVGALVATTGNISDFNFLNNNYSFVANKVSDLVNQGQIKGGSVALIGPSIRNEGYLIASIGDVVLASSDKVSLSFGPNQKISVAVDPSTIGSQINQTGSITSNSGKVLMEANVAQSFIDQTINGPTSANTIISANGVMRLVSTTGPIKAKQIEVSAGPRGQAYVNGLLDVSQTNGVGGSILALGREVTIGSLASLDATGTFGGGSILVGGDWQGSNNIPQSIYTSVLSGAVLDASATDHGHGGKIVAWSDITNSNSKTIAQGSFFSQGGANGGNGGKIETSGHELDVSGAKILLTSKKNNAGLWLIDPYNYTIDSLAASAIVSALNSGHVTLTTSSNNTSYGSNAIDSSAGDIIVSSDIISPSSNQLSLVALGDITINNQIIISGSGSKIDLNAQRDVNLNANILATNLDLVSGRNVTLNSGLGITGIANITANSGSISFGSSFADNTTYASSVTYNFSSGMDGWTSGIWEKPLGNFWEQRGTINSWTYRDGALYNPNDGSLGVEQSYVMSPQLSTQAGSTISFRSKNRNETVFCWAPGQCNGYDMESLHYSTNNGATWTELIGIGDLAWQSDTSFRDISVSIPTSSSNARFKFQYDTVDGCCGPPNPGWWIQDIVIGANISGNLGTLNLSSSQVSLNANVTTSGALTVNAPIELLGNSQLSSSVASLNQNINLSSYQLTINNSSASSSSGIISGAGSIVKSGLGSFTLSGANEYFGNTTISTGTLIAANNTALGATAGTTSISSNASLALQGGVSIAENITAVGVGVSSAGAILNNSGNNSLTGDITFSGTTTVGSTLGSLTIDSASTTINDIGSNLTFTGAGNISIADAIATASGTLTKSGAGTLTLSGANNYTGNTTMSGGKILLGHASGLGTSAVTVSSGTLDLNGYSLSNALNLSGTGLSNVGALYNSSTSSVVVSGAITLGGTASITSLGDITFNNAILGVIGQNNSLTMTATGKTIALNGLIGADPLTYTGSSGANPYALNVTAGLIRINNDITTNQNQTYTGAVEIGDNGSNGTTRTLLSLNPNVTFNSTVDDLVRNTHTLNIKSVKVLGGIGVPEINFLGNVGNIKPLYALSAIAMHDPTPAVAYGNIPGTYDTSSDYTGSITIGGKFNTELNQNFVGKDFNFGTNQPFSNNGNVNFYTYQSGITGPTVNITKINLGNNAKGVFGIASSYANYINANLSSAGTSTTSTQIPFEVLAKNNNRKFNDKDDTIKGLKVGLVHQAGGEGKVSVGNIHMKANTNKNTSNENKDCNKTQNSEKIMTASLECN
jgi:filamentous hemagglutinin family protein